MISLQKIGDSAVKFVFTDSDHYLYGNGEIEVPVNSLLLVIDESDMVTFKKLSGDPFLSFRADNSNLGTKAAIEQFYKDNMVGSSGGGSESGITSGEVQTMIDESISGKADTSDVTAVANDVSTLSGQVATKVAITDFNAYSAATDSRLAEDEEVTAAALNDLDERIGDPYQKVSGLTIDTDNQIPVITLQGEDENEGIQTVQIYQYGVDAYNNDEETGHNTDAYIFTNGTMGVYEHTEGQEGDEDEGIAYDKNIDLYPDRIELYALTTGDDYNGDESTFITKDNIRLNKRIEVDGEATESSIEIKNDDGTSIHFTDGSDELELNNQFFDWTDGTDSRSVGWKYIASLDDIDAATSGKADTSAITTAITSGSTDSEIPTAKAVYDATQSGGGGATSGITYDTPFITSGAFLHGQWYGFITDFGAVVPSIQQYVRLNVNGSLVTIGFNGSTNFYDGSGNLIDTPSYINQELNIWDSTNKRRYIFFKDGVYVDYIANTSGLKYTLYTETNSGETVELIQDHIFNDAVHTTSSEKTLWNTVSGKVETSAITSAMTSSSTDAQVPSAKAVYDALGGLKFVQCTQAEYDALVSGGTVDSSTIYFITNVVS